MTSETPDSSQSSDNSSGDTLKGTSRGTPIPEEYQDFIDPALWGKLNLLDLDDESNPPSEQHIGSFILFNVTAYKRQGLYGRYLWARAYDDFEEFEEQHFRVNKKACKILRSFMLEQGIWMGTNRQAHAINVATALQQYHVWTDLEIEQTASKYPRFLNNLDKIPRFREHLKEDPAVLAKAAVTAPVRPLQLQLPSPENTTPSPAPAIHHQQQQQLQYDTPRHTAPLTATDTPTEPDVPTSRQVTDLSKMYTEDNKYGGDIYDVLENKLLIFRDFCGKVSIPQTQFSHVFSLMLKGRALRFYFSNLARTRPVMQFTHMVQQTLQHFEPEEMQQTYLSEWRSITLAKMITEHPAKSKSEVFELLLERITLLHSALPTVSGSRIALKEQIINACYGQPECANALYRPAVDCEGVIQQIRGSIKLAASTQHFHTAATLPQEPTSNPVQYWTDRTFRGQGRDTKYGNRGSNPSSQSKKCYVCNKPDCWSTRHTADERTQAYRKFRTNRAATSTSQSSYKAFLTWHEGPEPTVTLSRSGSPDLVQQYFQELADSRNNEPSSEEDAAWEDSQQFFTSYFTSTTTIDGPALANQLANQAMYHAFTGRLPTAPTYTTESAYAFTLQTRYRDIFQGILPDTGASGLSTAGNQQFIALQKQLPSLALNQTAAGSKITFGAGPPTYSTGTIDVPTPLGQMVFHVVPADTPFLLCLADMDRMGITFDNLANVLRKGALTVPVIRKWGHPWMLLQPEIPLAFNHLTEAELRRVHRRCGHPSVQRLYDLLYKAGHDVEINAIRALTDICSQCQLHGTPPNRFKFTLRDDYEFNYEIVVDVVTLDDGKVLHVVDTATSFTAARFLRSLSAQDTWDALRLCWIDVYQGPPDWIVCDAGTNFHAAEFKAAARAAGISVKEVPIEAHNSIGKIERAHPALRRAYYIIRSADNTVLPESALQMAVKAINDTAGPNGLVPTLLVFGSYPRITEDSPPSPSNVRRAAAIHKAMKELQHLQAKRKVQEALAARNGPDMAPTISLPLQSQVRVWRENKGWQGPFTLIATAGQTCTLQLPHGPRDFRSTAVKPWHDDPEDQVLTTSPTSAVIAAENNTIHDEIIVSTTPDTPPQAQAQPRRGPGRPGKSHLPQQATSQDPIPQRRRRGRPRKHPLAPVEQDEPPQQHSVYISETDVSLPIVCTVAYLSSKEQDDQALVAILRAEGIITAPGEPFVASTYKEIDALISRGVFEFVPFDPKQHSGTRIFRSRIVNELKGKGTSQPYEKSRLVIQGFADDGKRTILTQAPTIQRSSQRLILALAPSLLLRGQHLWLRDITQAYVQAAMPLNRTILAKLPTQIQHHYPDNTIMKVVKPLYGIAEAGTYWWATYYAHHREKLQMETSTYDPCLLITTKENQHFGIVGMQTDDTIGVSDEAFDRHEDTALQAASFTAKPKERLQPDKPLAFNGGTITLCAATGIIQLRQKGQGEKLQLLEITPESTAASIKAQYTEQRARGAYIASICQPEACYDLSAAAQHQEPTLEQAKALNQRLQWQIDHQDRGIRYLPIDLSTAKLFVFVDGSLANNPDLTSQLGFAIILGNETAVSDDTFTLTGNLVHYSSTKCKRITRSSLASEVYGMVAGVDMAYVITNTINQVLERLDLPAVPTIACTDSYSLYECLVKLGTTQEKRLMVDIMALRQSYERRELFEIRWISGEDNLADAFTKNSCNKAFERFMDTATTVIRMEGWVAR